MLKSFRVFKSFFSCDKVNPSEVQVGSHCSAGVRTDRDNALKGEKETARLQQVLLVSELFSIDFGARNILALPELVISGHRILLLSVSVNGALNRCF